MNQDLELVRSPQRTSVDFGKETENNVKDKKRQEVVNKMQDNIEKLLKKTEERIVRELRHRQRRSQSVIEHKEPATEPPKRELRRSNILNDRNVRNASVILLEKRHRNMSQDSM